MTTLGDKLNEGMKKHQQDKEKEAIKHGEEVEIGLREQLKNNRLNESQMDFCLSKSKHIRLLAPAGSGKTLSLLWRCKAISERGKLLREKPARFLVVTFTRVARDELKGRLASDSLFADIRDSVRVTTLNEWGYQYLRSIEKSLDIVSSDRDRYNIMDHDFRSIFRASSKRLQNFYNKSARKRTRFVEMSKIFDTMKNCGFSHEGSRNELSDNFENHREWLNQNGLGRYFSKEITGKLIQLGILDESDISINGFRPFLKVWKDTCDELWKNGKVTLDDQKYRSFIEFRKRYGSDPSALPAPNRYQHVLVDEFQDISPLDNLLVKTLSDIYGSSLTIVGDDDQAIFEWRGSTPNFILNPKDYFEKEFQTHILKVNYRSPKNIVALSQALIRHNTKREKKDVISNVEEDAEILVRKFPTHNECVDYILEFAREANGKSEPRQLGIIGRKKGQLIPMQTVLISKDIPFFARQDLNVAFSKAFQDLKEILEIVSAEPNLGPPSSVADSFLKLLKYVKLYPFSSRVTRKAFGYLSNRDVSDIESCLKAIVNFDDLSDSDKESVCSAIPKILPNGRGVSEVINSIENNLEGLKKHYPKSEDDIFYREPPFLYLAEYASRYGDDFPQFIKHLGKAIEEMTKKIEENSVDGDMDNPVHIMTAFGAKGREFETTILLDVNDGVFPVKQAETDEQKEAERRIFYVATTRARKRMILLTVESILGRPVGPSPYIEEMGLEVPES